MTFRASIVNFEHILHFSTVSIAEFEQKMSFVPEKL